MTTIETTDQQLTANVVAAFLTRNDLAAEAVPGFISSVFGAFRNLGAEPMIPEAPIRAVEPAVSVRASVKPDALTCLCCGAKMKMLKRHLLAEHGLTPAAYRAKWDLPASYPMTAPAYSARRAELAIQIGLGRKPGAKVAKVGRPKKAA